MQVDQNHVGGDDGRERGTRPVVQVNIQIITSHTTRSSSPHAAGAILCFFSPPPLKHWESATGSCGVWQPAFTALYLLQQYKNGKTQTVMKKSTSIGELKLSFKLRP